MRTVLFLLLSCAIACSDPDADRTTTGTDTLSCEAPFDTYADGVSAAGETYEVAFLSADPAPPDRGDNRWGVQITDGSGNVRNDVAVRVEPFMPEHNHGTSPESFDATVEGDGFAFEPIDLFMPGLWVLTFFVDDGVVEDSVAFRFCLQG